MNSDWQLVHEANVRSAFQAAVTEHALWQSKANLTGANIRDKDMPGILAKTRTWAYELDKIMWQDRMVEQQRAALSAQQAPAT